MGKIQIVQALGRFCGGRFYAPATPAGLLERRSPADPQEGSGAFPFGEEDVDEAVTAAVRAARSWGARPLVQRSAALHRLRDALASRLGVIQDMLSLETGRPAWECQREAQGLLMRLDQTLRDAPEMLRDRSYQNLCGQVRLLPLGVVAITGPAMLPIGTSHTHVLAAVIAGNSVVWKPSPLCPASAQVYAEAWAAAELPPGVFNFVQGDDEVGRALALHAQVDAVVFIGTTAQGRALRRRVAEVFDRRLVLHLSAKNAAVVLEDADVDLAVYEIATGAFLSAGQRCTALSRALVHHEVLDEFMAKLLSLCASLRVGPPRSMPFMGPLLSEERCARFLRARAQAAEAQAEVILEGAPLDATPGCFVTPSVHLVHQRLPNAPYQRDELFGPDLAIYPVRDIDDALPLCDSTPYGLCAALFTRTAPRWQRFQEEVRAGALFWNRSCNAPSGRMPFGGLGSSGDGGVGGAEAMRALCRQVSALGRSQEAIEILPGVVDETLGEEVARGA